MIIPVVGVTFINEETGINRQDIIKKLGGREQVFLKREPENKHDSNAIAVMLKAKNPKRIGYINRELAVGLARLWKKYSFPITISEIRQGDKAFGKNWGISIEMKKIKRKTKRR